MTPDEVERVRATAAAAVADPGFATAFYDRLFTRAPEVRELFPESIDEQARKFADQLGVVLRSLDDFTAFSNEATTLGSRHAGYGVQARHYAIATDALVDALRLTLGDAVDRGTEAAWRAALDLVSEEMQAADTDA